MDFFISCTQECLDSICEDDSKFNLSVLQNLSKETFF